MKTPLLLTLIAVCAAAQDTAPIKMEKMAAEKMAMLGGGPVGVGMTLGENVKGAPYSATIVTESTQTLADGNRISQKNQGGVARDSQGRMRHEAILPVIGNMNAAATAPKFIFINDPVAGANYTLNPAEKVYRKMPVTISDMKRTAEWKMTTDHVGEAGAVAGVAGVRTGGEHTVTFERSASPMTVVAPPPGAGFEVSVMSGKISADQMQFKNESLGTKVIDGVVAEGTRSTRTIPAGQVGNERAIEIVSESWYSNDLKTVIYSKRSDPRSGDMIYSLTNISRAEPDASLFQVPADYRVSEATTGKDVIMYRTKE